MVNHYLTPGAIIDANNTWNGDIQTFSNGLTIGLAASAPAPDQDVVHIWAGDAGANVLANTSAVLVLESDSDHYLEFLSTTSNEAGLTFVDSLSSILGRFSYDHNGNTFTMLIGGGDRVTWSASGVTYAVAYAISTGSGDLTLSPTGTVVLNSISAGVTANTNSTQGDNPITKMVTQISVSATAGDAVTLPTAKAGLVIIVLNDGAEAADVFPASGDNINEAGANAAYSLAVDKNAMFIAHDATHWSVILTA
jgi:ABC-type amino acid transport system permease subunit